MQIRKYKIRKYGLTPVAIEEIKELSFSIFQKFKKAYEKGDIYLADFFFQEYIIKIEKMIREKYNFAGGKSRLWGRAGDYLIFEINNTFVLHEIMRIINDLRFEFFIKEIPEPKSKYKYKFPKLLYIKVPLRC